MTDFTECCMKLLVALVIVSLAFILSLMINIVHCVKKHRKGKVVKYCSQATISYDQQYIENNPIYGNLALPFLDYDNDECCYESMATPHERNMEENQQVDPEELMCYADLDLSPKRPGKNRKKKAKIKSKQRLEELDRTNASIISRSSIYLNSEQLTAELRAHDELIHDDPVRIYHLMKKTRNNLQNEEEN
ncbi:T-cell receptor-associated transmembrane adapter 1 isoform X1 [Hyla sarda]|uniref:T-cell receptor-associated transmembrane adapter 1 isoform X1 n=1 Tax=Hyla sarda TaxID=327740 RepID=UPI0024C25516|nr:T-cell receptor-associated transmembrane adapter 1 isoform X1 [Hyla sarda]XP_056412274.1 T-cell receptor-associated transmembrane adapter 1 isoform X1 [Hyla sarda]